MNVGVLAVVCLAAVMGCGEASSTCAPGAQISCACPGSADGVQSCSADGTGYEECDCGAGGSTSTSSTSSAETGGGGAAGGAGGVGGGSGGSGTTSSSSSSSSTTTCYPAVCNGWTCGTFDDGCGGTIVCGADCPAPQVCAATCKCDYQLDNFNLCGSAGMVAAYCGAPDATVPEGCTYTHKLANDGNYIWCCPPDQVT